MTATVHKLTPRPSIARLACTNCGAETNAACDCGVEYRPAAERAADALAEHPELSDRAIANDIGVSPTTVGKARKATVHSGQLEKRIGLDGKERANPFALGTGGGDEWHTPVQYLKMARDVLGGVDLDPASSAFAKRRYDFGPQCRHYTKADNGLTKPWHGRVWLNPPFSKGNMSAFVDKLLQEYDSGRVTSAILLTNAFTPNVWWQKAGHAAAAICLMKKRINFESEGRETPGGQIFGQSFFFFGCDAAPFIETFRPHGVCVEVK
jgi:ParB family chromosome partitioning protein